MKEFVTKKVMKVLDYGLIYLILYLRWISPVQCVPKKRDMTVLQNEEGKLMVTQPITR